MCLLRLQQITESQTFILKYNKQNKFVLHCLNGGLIVSMLCSYIEFLNTAKSHYFDALIPLPLITSMSTTSIYSIHRVDQAIDECDTNT